MVQAVLEGGCLLFEKRLPVVFVEECTPWNGFLENLWGTLLKIPSKPLDLLASARAVNEEPRFLIDCHGMTHPWVTTQA